LFDFKLTYGFVDKFSKGFFS